MTAARVIGTLGAVGPVRPIDRVLPRLIGITERRPGQWTAACPVTHHGAPLLVTEGRDGRVILDCQASPACTRADVLDALDLVAADLYPPRPGPGPPTRSGSRRPRSRGSACTWTTSSRTCRRSSGWCRA